MALPPIDRARSTPRESPGQSPHVNTTYTRDNETMAGRHPPGRTARVSISCSRRSASVQAQAGLKKRKRAAAEATAPSLFRLVSRLPLESDRPVRLDDL